MRAFISYSVSEKKWAGAVKGALEPLGVVCFLAHEDMKVSEEWRNRIVEELGLADIFVPILSENFKESEWCGQEVGFIVSRPEVTTVPLTLDGTTPYGFLAQLQGKSITSESEIPFVFEEVLFRRFPRQMIPPQIKKVREAKFFRGAEAAVKPLASHFAIFSDDEVTAFAKAASENVQVWDATLCRSDYIPEFVAVNGGRIPLPLQKVLREKIEDLIFPS